jgi:hypothetical protein
MSPLRNTSSSSMDEHHRRGEGARSLRKLAGCFYFDFLNLIKKICIYTQVLYQSIYYFNEVLALHIVVVLVSIGIIMRRHCQHDHRKNEHIIVVFIFIIIWCTPTRLSGLEHGFGSSFALMFFTSITSGSLLYESMT